MIINKNNYEEYFLLFADNELSEQEKYAVEDFVKHHPDLEEELLIIKQAIIKPDDNIKLDDKSFLFKKEREFINHENYKEILILYNDDELTAAERKETETFLSENASLKSEFELFKKVKLQPEKDIIFPDKKLLYKKDSDEKVLRMRWKALAAAIIAGLGIWIGVDYLVPHKNNLPVAVENNPTKIKGMQPVATQTKPLIQTENSDSANKDEKNTVLQKMIAKNTLPKAKNSITKLSKKEAGVLKSSMVIKIHKESNYLPVKVIDDKIIDNEKKLSIKEERSQNNVSIIKKDIQTNNSTNKISTQNYIVVNNKSIIPDALSASYASDENENSDNYAFYNMPQEKFSKTRLGGLLHKIKRVVERRFLIPIKDSQETAHN